MKVLIVDDEMPNREGLKLLIEKHCPEIYTIGVAENSTQAREYLMHNSIDVLLLDINMPNENGFELLDSIPQKNFMVIFVTAYTEYAVRAFKANAIDYLLKPIDETDLIESIHKCKERISKSNIVEEKILYNQSIKNAGIDFETRSYPKKLTLPHLHGFQIIAIEEIVYLEADGNYTTLHLLNNEKLLVTKGIKEFENLLNPLSFFRAHKSSIINLNYIKEYSSIDGQTAVMQNGAKVVISRRRLDEFMNAINNFSSRV